MRLNKKATLDSQSIPIEDKILALNEAQIKLIKRKLNSNNIYGLGMDSFTKRYEDLQKLVVDFEKLTVTKNTTGYPSYKADLDTLTKDYMFPLEMFVLCTKGNCNNRTLAITKIIRHGDLSTMLFNRNYSPSFEYQETLATISDNKVNIYTDSTFTINTLNISYIRYPQRIDIAGYFTFDGSPSITQDSELADYLQDELLDLATLELAMETENNPQVQYSDIRNKINE